MKFPTILTLTAIAGLFATSCSNKYENAVTDYIQTGNVAKLDLGLKIKEAKEVRTITIADSVEYLTKKNDLEKVTIISGIEANIAKYQDIVVSGIDGQKLNQTLSDAYLSEIEKAKLKADSLRTLPAATITMYEGRKASDVLAQIVEVSYEVENPVKETITADFLLSEDGKTCFGITDNKEMSPEK